MFLCFCRVVNSHSDERIGASVEEIPLAFKRHKSLGEDCSRRVLSALLEVVLRIEVRLVQAVQEFRRVFQGEERLPCTIGPRGIVQVAIVPTPVLPVVEEHDAMLCLDGRRAALHKLAVEVTSARVHDMKQLPVRSQHGRPVDEVVAGGDVDEVLAPIHHILALDACNDLPAFLHLRHNGARLREALAQLALVVVGEDGAMLCPMHKVATCGNAQPGQFVVPTCIGHHIEAVLSHTDTRVFAASWHIELLPVVASGKEDRSAVMLEVDAVLAEGIADAGSARTDALGDVVLSTIEQRNAPIDEGCSRVEGLAVLPLRHPLPHRAEEAACRVGAHNGVCSRRPLEAQPSPSLLAVRNFV